MFLGDRMWGVRGVYGAGPRRQKTALDKPLAPEIGPGRLQVESP